MKGDRECQKSSRGRDIKLFALRRVLGSRGYTYGLVAKCLPFFTIASMSSSVTISFILQYL